MRRGAAGILTGVQPKGGRVIKAETSVDQILAQRLGDTTALPSLVLACERSVSGFHESGYSMLYSSHVSWSSPVSPVPAELYPSLAFDSLFESQGSRTHLSVLDHVLERLQDVTRKASGSDRAKIEEYATSVREVEQRLAKLNNTAREEAGISSKVQEQRPADGLSTQLNDHARLMADIVALAFQTDRTRIATMLLTNNLSGQVYPFLGLRDDHHSFSHNWQGKEFASITRFWVEQYAYHTCPDVTVSRPARQCISVDFPEPDGPMMAVTRPVGSSSETPSSARTAVAPSPYTFTTSTAAAATPSLCVQSPCVLSS